MAGLDELGRPSGCCHRLGQPAADHREGLAVCVGQVGVQRGHLGHQGAEGGALVAQQLAVHQVHALDAVGAFVDGGDAHVAQMLGDAGFLDVAHAAEHLHRQVGHLDARGRRPGLDHRSQQLDAGVDGLAHRRVGVALRDVDTRGDVVGQRPRRLHQGPRGQQHAADVGVLDDGHVLDAFAGIGHRLLGGALGHRDAFQAHRQAGVVHHGEHQPEALVFAAQQPADGAFVLAEGHDAGGAGVDAQLLLDLDAFDVVAPAQAAIGVDQELGHREQRDALDAGRCVGDAGQHQMDDVGGGVVLAAGDEDLLSADAPSVAVRLGLAAQRAHVGAGRGLGEVHGPGPLAGHQLVDEHVADRGRGVLGDGLHRALGQHGDQAERHVRGVPYLLHRRRHQPGQPLAAMVGGEGHGVPTALDEPPIGLDEAGRQGDAAVLQPAAFAVARRVERRQHLGTELAGLLQHGGNQVGRRLLAAGQGGDLGQPAHLLDGEQHVGDGRGEDGHGGTLLFGTEE